VSISVISTTPLVWEGEGSHGSADKWRWVEAAGCAGIKIRGCAKFKEAPSLHVYPKGFGYKAGVL